MFKQLAVAAWAQKKTAIVFQSSFFHMCFHVFTSLNHLIELSHSLFN